MPAGIPHQEFSHDLIAATAAANPKSDMPSVRRRRSATVELFEGYGFSRVRPWAAGVSHGREERARLRG